MAERDVQDPRAPDVFVNFNDGEIDEAGEKEYLTAVVPWIRVGSFLPICTVTVGDHEGNRATAQVVAIEKRPGDQALLTLELNDDFTPAGPTWVPCACGKEWQAPKDWPFPATEGVTFACRTCEADLAEETDSCPEIVRHDRGSSACTLPRRHVGRCEPYRWETS